MSTKTTCIILPEVHRRTVIEHCRRKMAGKYVADELQEKKAYGLIAGTLSDTAACIKKCFPLYKNGRSQTPFKKYMDKIMQEHAVPSVTPLDKRGWVADPEELLACQKTCHRENLHLLGTYHMHRVSWDHDRRRDTPTHLDTILAADSGLIMFVISMVDPALPIIRAFYEGQPDHEIPIITPEENV